MAVVTPTVTTSDSHEYRDQMEQIVSFADGVHVDFADGVFAPTELLSIDQAWRPEQTITHMHVMYQDPLPHVQDIITFNADLVVLHAESSNIREALEKLQDAGVRTGLALLPETSVSALQELGVDELFEHVLVFAGHLGYQGGEADPSQLEKVRALKAAYPDVEIGWDGGVDEENIQIIAGAGVDILNVGGSIKSAKDPKKAYDKLTTLLS